METFLKEIEQKVKEYKVTQDKVAKEYKKACDFFMFKKDDPSDTEAKKLRTNSLHFFEFFINFFGDVQKALPKDQKKKQK